MRHVLVSIFICSYLLCAAQGHVVSIRPLLDGVAVDTAEGNALEGGTFYLTKLQGYAHTKEEGARVEADQTWMFDLGRLDKELATGTAGMLMLGVDSALNYDGVHGGDLDPIHGMYWTWQTGYIHCKIEGIFELSGKRVPLEFHLGGFDSLHDGPFEIGDAQDEMTQVEFDLGPALRWALLEDLEGIMSPGLRSERFAEELMKGVRVL